MNKIYIVTKTSFKNLHKLPKLEVVREMFRDVLPTIVLKFPVYGVR